MLYINKKNQAMIYFYYKLTSWALEKILKVDMLH